MQRLGLVLHVSPSRNIIVRAERTPKIGEAVVDEHLKLVGRVFDIFGPTASPYASIRPTIREPEKLVNKKVYLFPKKGETKK